MLLSVVFVPASHTPTLASLPQAALITVQLLWDNRDRDTRVGPAAAAFQGTERSQQLCTGRCTSARRSPGASFVTDGS
jgi:hypothetical protein